MQEMTSILDIKGPADWENRPNFRPVLHGTADDLKRIVGKYDLPRPPAGMPRQSGMVHCGLNGCNELHFRGFLILLKNDLETIIGRDCGREKMGAVFEEIEATFVAQETLFNRQKLLAELQSTRQTLIQQAGDLLPKCEQTNIKIKSMVSELSRFTGFWRKLEDVARMNGRVMVAAKVSAMTEQGSSIDLVEAARIQHCHLFFSDTSLHPRKLQIQVVKWLRFELDDEIKAAGDDLKKLEALTIKATELREILRAAAEFLREAQLFLAPSNLRGLDEIVSQQLGQSQRSNALRRALQRLTATPGATRS